MAEPEIRNQGPILLQIRPFQIFEQPATLSDHLQQAAARMVVLVMRPEMVRQVIDAPGEQGDLNPRRSAVVFVESILLNDGVAIDLCHVLPPQESTLLAKQAASPGMNGPDGLIDSRKI
jgi:hypothetical protein